MMKKFLCLILALILLSMSLVSCATQEEKDAFDDMTSELNDILSSLEALPASEEVDSLTSEVNVLLTELSENGANKVAKASDDYLAKISDLRVRLSALLLSQSFAVSESVTNYVQIEVKGFGYIVVELAPEVAPKTVENFQMLVEDGFYDGLIFHRVIKNFMIQGGDPKGNGTGGADKNIVGEFASNGFANNLSHKRGVISMARSQSPNSASSQFFICHADSPHLDGEYAAFGEVVYGMDVVDAIASVKTNASDKPLTNVVIKSMQFVERIAE